VQDLVELKFEGSDSSMGVRFDQIDVAARHLGENPPRDFCSAAGSEPSSAMAGSATRSPNTSSCNRSAFWHATLERSS